MDTASRAGSNHGRRLFVWTSWIPLGVFFAIQADVSRSEGWGAWAVATALVIPVSLSAIYVVAGLVIAWRARGTSSVALWVGVAIASVPALWFAWRLVVAA